MVGGGEGVTASRQREDDSIAASVGRSLMTWTSMVPDDWPGRWTASAQNVQVVGAVWWRVPPTVVVGSQASARSPVRVTVELPRIGRRGAAVFAAARHGDTYTPDHGRRSYLSLPLTPMP